MSERLTNVLGAVGLAALGLLAGVSVVLAATSGPCNSKGNVTVWNSGQVSITRYCQANGCVTGCDDCTVSDANGYATTCECPGSMLVCNRAFYDEPGGGLVGFCCYPANCGPAAPYCKNTCEDIVGFPGGWQITGDECACSPNP